MLAEINLLPRKDRKNQAKLIILLVILVMTIIVLTILGFQINALNKAEVVAEHKQSILQEQLDAKNEVRDQESESSEEKLQSAVNFAEVTSQDVIPVVGELTEQLPERGYLMDYEQVDPWTIHLTVQFDMNRDAAFYLARLKESQTFEQVFLEKITTKSENNDETLNKLDVIEMPRINARYYIKVRANEDITENGGGDTNDDATS